MPTWSSLLVRSLGRTLTCLPVALADGQGLGEVGGMNKVFSQNSGGRDGKGGRGGGTDMGQLLTTPMSPLPVPRM